MHELLLFGVVGPNQHDQILSLLAGLTAMQPVPLLEQHHLFKPTRAPAAPNTSGRPNPGPRPGPAGTEAFGSLVSQISNDLFFLSLVGDLSGRRKGIGKIRASPPPSEPAEESDVVDHGGPIPPPLVGNAAKDVNHPDFAGFGAENIPCTLEFRDLPDVIGKKPATSRLMSSIPVTEGQSKAFLEAMGYVHVSSHYVSGYTLSHDSTFIRLFKTFPVPDPPEITSLKEIDELPALDQSGSYILELSLRVQDGSKPEMMQRGFDELVTLQTALKGIIELGPGDRLAMDPRVR